MTESLPDLAALMPSWHRTVRSTGKSPKTVTTYTAGVNSFLRWCERTGTPAALTKANAQTWIADLLGAGTSAKSADTWLGGLKRFAAWLAEEEELPFDPLVRMSPPKFDQKVTDPLTEDELKRLIKVCQGKSLRDRRDEAIVRLLAETGIRVTELVDLSCDDLDADLRGGQVSASRISLRRCCLRC
ncbi:tyrosine-type recombinase/integrase [uncultured Mycobacterium sp.]|uniref:tyrosine-type recombinase/integrase n=1 Tax=uncultured Mycobacterium sp. TaxID=171292 RepID=UPI0035CB59E9